MERNEYIFIALVGMAALLFAGLAWQHGAPETGGETGLTPAAQGGGQVREFDVEQVRRRIERGGLSDHEALYYRKHETDSAPEKP